MALAAYREANHAGVLDQLGLGIVAAAIAMLGLLIALVPWSTFHWRRNSDD